MHSAVSDEDLTRIFRLAGASLILVTSLRWS
jgi:hypothetical protein